VLQKGWHTPPPTLLPQNLPPRAMLFHRCSMEGLGPTHLWEARQQARRWQLFVLTNGADYVGLIRATRLS